jgi:HAE1 family hydrophobic/amphiphilic exporter-1
MQDLYVAGLAWLLARQRRPAWLMLATIVATTALMLVSNKWPDTFLKIDMFPQDAGRQLALDYRIEGAHPIERVAAAVDKVEAYFEPRRQDLDIDMVYSRFDTESAVTVFKLTDKDAARLSVGEILALATPGLPDIVIGKPTFRFEDSGAGAGFSVQISGDSTERLAQIAADVSRVLGSLPGLSSVRSDARNGDQEIEIMVDRARASALGLTPQQVATSVAAAMRGDRLRELRTPEREYTLRLAFRDSDKQSISDLARLPLYLSNGERIRLDAVANFRVSRGARTIERINRLTSVTLQGLVEESSSLNAVKARVERVLNNYQLPAGYSWKFGRGVEQDDEAQQVMSFNLLLAIAMIFLVMAAVFESALLPVSIIASIVFAVIGVLWTLFLTRTTMTFMSLIGVQVLMGIVVNIGIVLIAHVNDLRSAGLGRHAAILQAARDRLRPILMTTATTVLGLSPLAIGDSQLAVGTGGPSYAPMARAIMGGLAFGALTSLFVVPVLYVWLDELRSRCLQWWVRAAAAET